MKKQGTDKLKAEGKELMREVQKKVRQSYWSYIGKLFIEPSQAEAEEGAKPCLKKFWTYIKHQRTTNTGVSPLKAQGRLITDPKQKAEELNAQFNQLSIHQWEGLHI